MPRVILAAAAAVAVWPVWGWYLARLFDRSDEPWCAIALLTAAAILACAPSTEPAAFQSAARRGAALLAAYAAAALWLPPIFHCAAAFLAIGLTLAPRGPVWGLAGLLILSAPLASSLDFYLGYPLRSLVTNMSAATLEAAGIAVSIDGARLASASRVVEVDAPCSGVRMLWTALYLTFTLAAIHGLTFRRTAAAVTAAIAIVIAANVLRASALFFLETAPQAPPPFLHAAVGVAMFALSGAAILALHQRLREMPA